MSGEDIITQADVEKVAEMAVEPSYVSEIARKLKAADPVFHDMGENRAIRIVSRAVQALRKNNRVTVEHPSYPELGSQKAASPHTSIAGEGFSSKDEWNEYTVVYNSGTDASEVRTEYRDYVDPSIPMADKMDTIAKLSTIGNEMSMKVEEILYDQVRGQVSDYVALEQSDYNSPGVDCYVQEFTAPDGTPVERGLAIEISTRYVNPVGGPYISNKLAMMQNKESETGVPVDLVVLAPEFTRGMLDKYEDSDMVHLIQLPNGKKGTPVVVQDAPDQRHRDDTEDVFGPDYPIIGDRFGDFVVSMSGVLRDYAMVPESQYRMEITEAINAVA
jgi:hypothetical protein